MRHYHVFSSLVSTIVLDQLARKKSLSYCKKTQQYTLRITLNRLPFVNQHTLSHLLFKFYMLEAQRFRAAFRQSFIHRKGQYDLENYRNVTLGG